MIGWIRNIVIVFLLLTIVYAVLSFTGRMKERARLKSEYKSDVSKITTGVSHDVYVEKGMKNYHRSYRPKLIFGVYLVPLFIIGVLMYLAQYS
ncbi:MAG: hypothetical protein ACPGVT_02620 [Maricaulaceae bacterium]